jgi:hypothetical protein
LRTSWCTSSCHPGLRCPPYAYPPLSADLARIVGGTLTAYGDCCFGGAQWWVATWEEKMRQYQKEKEMEEKEENEKKRKK